MRFPEFIRDKPWGEKTLGEMSVPINEKIGNKKLHKQAIFLYNRNLFNVLNEENYAYFSFELLIIPDSKKIKLNNGEVVSVN